MFPEAGKDSDGLRRVLRLIIIIPRYHRLTHPTGCLSAIPQNQSCHTSYCGQLLRGFCC